MVRALRAGVVEAVERVGSLERVFDLVCGVVAEARGLVWPAGLVPASSEAGVAELLAGWREPGASEHLGAVYESVLTDRKESGAFYTPQGLADWLLDRVLATGGQVLDPACGTGHVLVAAARRGVATTELWGGDRDPVAVLVCRFLLWLEDPSVPWSDIVDRVRVGDGLREWGDLGAGGGFDAVVGNPPFLGQLRSATARQGATDGAAAYTDTSALFLLRSLGLVRPGGVVALVQPMSFLSARDAAPVRGAVAEAGALEALWSSQVPVFRGTAVTTCAPVVRVGAAQGAVGSWRGPTYDAAGTVAATAAQIAGEWGFLVAPGMGVPDVSFSDAHGTLGDLAACTADFRDQYYGLVPFVREAEGGVPAADEAPLITTGAIEPAESCWGRRPTRFAKRDFAAPVVDLVALGSEPGLALWAERRLVPKVLVAAQGPVIEAVVDEAGAWLPSVPTVTVTASPDRLWHVLAVLLAPPVVAHAAGRYAGVAMTVTSIKLSARQLAALPLPRDAEAWESGAALARAAQRTAGADERARLLAQCAVVMCAAYGVDDDRSLAWWCGRARIAYS